MSALETDHNEKEYQTSVQSVCVFNETQIKLIDCDSVSFKLPVYSDG